MISPLAPPPGRPSLNEIHVFDAFGTEVWTDVNIPKVTGSASVSVDYGGAALKSGALHQFRAISIDHHGVPISATEDLREIFCSNSVSSPRRRSARSPEGQRRGWQVFRGRAIVASWRISVRS